MQLYALVSINHDDRAPHIQNVIAVYTDEELANNEAEWRTRTENPRYSEPIDSMNPHHHRRSTHHHTYMTRSRVEYRVLVTELITDKFTEFAIKGK